MPGLEKNPLSENVLHFTRHLQEDGWPQLNTVLCMGGTDLIGTSAAIHMIVATPGRLKDCLEKKKFNFNILKYWCLGMLHAQQCKYNIYVLF